MSQLIFRHPKRTPAPRVEGNQVNSDDAVNCAYKLKGPKYGDSRERGLYTFVKFHRRPLVYKLYEVTVIILTNLSYSYTVIT